jgi:hypothetical protein
LLAGWSLLLLLKAVRLQECVGLTRKGRSELEKEKELKVKQG